MSELYIEGPRHYRITDDNHGAKVLAAAYIMMCQTILSIFARGSLKYWTARKWGWDDTAAGLASMLAVGYTGAMAAAYRHGMGQHIAAVSPSDVEKMQQVCLFPVVNNLRAEY